MDHSATVIVRADGAWWLATLTECTPTELSLAQVLQLVEASAIGGRQAPTAPTPSGPTPRVVAPLATLAGRATGGTLLVTGTGGRSVALDGVDVRMVDALTGPTEVEDLAVPSDPVERHTRADRLVADGVICDVTMPPAGAPTVGSAPEIPAATPTVPATSTSGATPSWDTSTASVTSPDTRIPVYSVWHRTVGPLLSLAMLTAATRAHDDGALNERFEIRRPETPESFLEDLSRRTGPAVLLCSDYVFTIEDNLRTARRALAIHPDLVVVHGGPSSPKYEADAEQFLDEHGEVAHILTRGEGERTICDLLEALDSSLPEIDPVRLSTVDGLCFRDPNTRELVRTPDRDRIADLDSLPSPFLTGEFDEIALDDWSQPPYFETNRGCPYACTFCDWGSATQSRIRKFDLDRVAAEFEWAASRGLSGTYICDANFGILPRDVEIAERLAEIRSRLGAPSFVTFTPAKNTTRHLTRILDVFRDAGIATNTSISLQTTDDTTLDVVGRHNISTDAYLALAADLRRRGHALTGDLILGLPGQGYETYRADLQFMLDHEIMPRTFSLRMLPNAPMNAPDYRSQHSIRTNENQVVVSTSTLDPHDRARAARLRNVEAITERYGLLRHVMRHLQWDQGIAATTMMESFLVAADTAPDRYPSIAWIVAYFDLFPVAPFGWTNFYGEVHRLAVDELGAADSTALRCVLKVQEFLMPAPGRTFPDSVRLEHDYVAYYTEATAELYRSGHASRPGRPLDQWGGGELTVRGDPLGVCARGLEFWGDSRDETFEGDFQIGALAANELDSPLVRLLPGIAANRDVVSHKLEVALGGAPTPLTDDEDHAAAVAIGIRSPASADD